MTKFNVHLYREMKLRFDGIEAESPQEAADLARLCTLEGADDFAECDGEDFAALVDVVGDEEFSRSEIIDFEGKRLRKTARSLSDGHRILITVEGGVIQDIEGVPAGIVVEVRDYDRDGDREHPTWSEEHQAFVGVWTGKSPEEAGAKLLSNFAHAEPSPEEKPYSVLLLYPDYANDSGHETYYAFVTALDSLVAVRKAQKAASEAQIGVEIDPDDFAPLLVTEGHHFGEALYNR